MQQQQQQPTQTNQDLRTSQPPRAREPQVVTNLSRLWSEGFPLSFPRRQQETGGNGPSRPAPPRQQQQHGRRAGWGGTMTDKGDEGFQQPAALQPRQPRRFVLRQRRHQHRQRDAIGAAAAAAAVPSEDGGAAGRGEGELTLPPLLPPLRLSVQHRPRKTVLLRQLRRRRLLKRLLSSSPTGSPR